MKIIQTITGKYQTNSYLVYDEDSKNAILIDPGEIVEELENAIEEHNLKVVKILLTHGHLDHISQVEHYREKYHAIVGAFKDEKELLKDPSLNLTNQTKNIVSLDCDEYYEDGQIIEPFSIKVIHTPGHTLGSCCYQLEKYIFSGDTLFHNSVGRWDLPTGNLGSLMESVQKLFEQSADSLVYPGHGSSTDINYEKLTNPFSSYK